MLHISVLQNAYARAKRRYEGQTNNIIFPHTGVLRNAYARIILLLPHIGGYRNAYTRTILFFFYSRVPAFYQTSMCDMTKLFRIHAHWRSGETPVNNIIFYYTAHRRFRKTPMCGNIK